MTVSEGALVLSMMLFLVLIFNGEFVFFMFLFLLFLGNGVRFLIYFSFWRVVFSYVSFFYAAMKMRKKELKIYIFI